MSWVIPAITIATLLIVIFAFLKFEYGIAIYAAYVILVPILQFSVGGVSLSYNFINAMLFVSVVYHVLSGKLRLFGLEPIRPFVVLYLALLLIIPLASKTPMGYQFSGWRGSMMMTVFPLIPLWLLHSNGRPVVKITVVAITISMAIASVYGFYLMKLGGLNPYTSYISQYSGIVDAADIYSSLDSRLSFSSAGKIQSTMIHPMRWAIVICFNLILFSVILSRKRSIFVSVLIAGLIGNLIISGVRTGIAAIIIGGGYYLVKVRNVRVAAYFVMLFIAAVIAISMNSELTDLFVSMTDISGTKSNVKGSSIEMRMDQLMGALDEMMGSPVFGNGYDWHRYYTGRHGDHPIMLAFESLAFIVLCNSGIYGVVAWVVFFVMLMSIPSSILRNRNNQAIVETLVIVYFSYAIGTGEYTYMPLFSFNYCLTLAYLQDLEEKGSVNAQEA